MAARRRRGSQLGRHILVGTLVEFAENGLDIDENSIL